MLTPDQIQAAVAVASFLGTGLLFWWRLTKRLHEHVTALNAALTAVDKLRVQVAHTGKRTQERLDLLAQDWNKVRTELATNSVLMAEREKDIVRLEGQIENLGSIVTKQVSAVAGAVSSLDAIWRTLQRLHPTAVPKRASDK